MYQTRGKKVEIPRNLDTFMWILSIAMLLAVLFVSFYFDQLLNKVDATARFENALFLSTSRVVWCLAVAWSIFACQNGSGGIVRWFLSLPQWQPLGKMGLSIYLVQYGYQFIVIYSQKKPLYWNATDEFQKVPSDVCVAVFFGALLYLSVESPVFAIENFLYRKFKKIKN